VGAREHALPSVPGGSASETASVVCSGVATVVRAYASAARAPQVACPESSYTRVHARKDLRSCTSLHIAPARVRAQTRTGELAHASGARARSREQMGLEGLKSGDYQVFRGKVV
jgi:hypothetical protein